MTQVETTRCDNGGFLSTCVQVVTSSDRPVYQAPVTNTVEPASSDDGGGGGGGFFTSVGNFLGTLVFIAGLALVAYLVFPYLRPLRARLMRHFKGERAASSGAGASDGSSGSARRHHCLPQPSVQEAMEEIRIEMQRLGKLLPPTPPTAAAAAHARAPRATPAPAEAGSAVDADAAP